MLAVVNQTLSLFTVSYVHVFVLCHVAPPGVVDVEVQGELNRRPMSGMDSSRRVVIAEGTLLTFVCA